MTMIKVERLKELRIEHQFEKLIALENKILQANELNKTHLCYTLESDEDKDFFICELENAGYTVHHSNKILDIFWE